MIYLVILLVASLLLNAFLAWHNRRLVGDLLYIEGETAELEETIEEFSSHLEIIYGLETFYGDETLKNLLRHTKAVGVFVSKFKNATALLFTDEVLDDEEEDEYSDTDEESKEEGGELRWRGEKHDFGLVK